MTDTWTWATVTQATPLRIKVDGDTTPLDATTDNLVGSLAVDDRVRVHLHSDGIIVTGIQGGGNRSNPNLLINSNFIVNQRGAVSGATVPANGYFLDRWKGPGSPVAFSWTDTGGVRTLAWPVGGLFQIIEAANAPAGTYTLSWEGTILARVYNAGGTVPSFASSPITVTLNGTDVVVNLISTDNDTLENVKLEQGSVATPYQPPTYADNLRACMRYYQRFGGAGLSDHFGVGYAKSTTVVRITVPLLVSMRTSGPTVTYNDLLVDDGSTSFAVSSLVPVSPMNNVAPLGAGTSGVTQYRPYDLMANTTASFVAFDAEM